jgi:aubergine-like protein
MRNDFNLMKAISAFTRLNPEKRVDSLHRFNKRIKKTPAAVEALQQWNVELNSELINVDARQLAKECIIFGNEKVEEPNHKAEWTFRGTTMFKGVACTRWIFLYPLSIEREAKKMLDELISAARSMNYEIRDPLMKAILDDKVNSYTSEIELCAQKKPNFILIALPTNRADRYSAMKRKCLIDLGIPCQVVVKNKTMNHKSLGSICTKLAIQINCKLGGVPWMVRIPVSKMMVVGFDVSHHPRDKSKSIGALVCSMDMKNMQNPDASSAFFSTTMEYRDGNEMVKQIDIHMKQAIEAFKEICGEMPAKIVFYRDGIGEGQIKTVMLQEVEPLKKMLIDNYGSENLCFIIVNKKINTRFFKMDHGYVNPVPGTVIDKTITTEEKNE